MSTDRDPSKPIPLHPVVEPPTDGMPRRVALRAHLGGVGAGFELPSTADAQHPMHQHLSNPAVIQQAQQRAAVTASMPAFLDDSSETGMRELGWDGDVFHQQLPGCNASRRPSGLISATISDNEIRCVGSFLWGAGG